MFKIEQKLDVSSPYIKFGINQMINDQVTKSVQKCILTGGGHFCGYLDYHSSDKTHILTWVRV